MLLANSSLSGGRKGKPSIVENAQYCSLIPVKLHPLLFLAMAENKRKRETRSVTASHGKQTSRR